MKHTTSKKKNVLPRLKLWLLQGRTITQLQAYDRFRTTRLAEFIRQLRHDHGMDVKKRMIKTNDSHYAEYYVEKRAKKVSRISTRQYMEQAYSKTLK